MAAPVAAEIAASAISLGVPGKYCGNSIDLISVYLAQLIFMPTTASKRFSSLRSHQNLGQLRLFSKVSSYE